MNAAESLLAYRRMVAAPDDSTVCWWYSGWTFVEIAGHEDVPICSVVAIMRYETATLGDAAFQIRWSEIGAFRDPATSERARARVNPITGQSVQIPPSFEEGPGVYTVSAGANARTVGLALQQPFADVRELNVQIRRDAARCFVVQAERKVRGYPLADGSLPPPGSAAGFEAETRLSFFAATGDLRSDDLRFVPCQGTYLFTLTGVPAWMGFGTLQGRTITRGVITKARPGEVIDPTGHALLAQNFTRKISHF
jgi:hypothetical protein